VDVVSAELISQVISRRAQGSSHSRVTWILCLVSCACALASGCGQSSPLLSNAHPSSQALAIAVLDGIARRDSTVLRGLALNEQEFREHVWPELPASRPERNLPFSYVWGDLRQKSEASLSQTLARHGGRRYTLVSVQFAGETTRYPSYTVFRETVLRVRDEQGIEADLRIFGSSLEKDDTWKVFSYVVDD
jgi:hypothetical protein